MSVHVGWGWSSRVRTSGSSQGRVDCGVGCHRHFGSTPELGCQTALMRVPLRARFGPGAVAEGIALQVPAVNMPWSAIQWSSSHR